ncbi:MAG: tyrosine-protein phosphatase [Clostridia bacterium]|nr:tyrosine-protein phosphatase [Clostridia bacterium]
MQIKIRGTRNLRDLGGLRNSYGETVREHLFIRGSQLSKISGRSAGKISKLVKPATVVDLRTDAEHTERPDKTIPGAAYVHVPLFSEETAGLSHAKGQSLKTIATGGHTKAALLEAIPDLENVYPVMATSREAIDGLREALDIIISNARSGKATLYHCTAGKDRTGIVSMLLLHMLDVDYDTIVNEYMLSNSGARADIIKYCPLIFIATGSIRCARKLKEVLKARKRYLDSFIAAASRDFGSIDGFITDALGISPETIESLKEAALVR